MPLPPPSSYQPAPLRIANQLARALWKTGLGRPSLSEASLLAAARRATGLHFLGEQQSFREPLRILLRALEDEADLNPVGRIFARQNLVGIFRNRLRAQDWFDRHPEILERRIQAPVVVMGLGRSGTTLLHRLLAADPRFMHLRTWESMNPVPAREAGTDGRPDPRIARTEGALRLLRKLAPQVFVVHPLETHAPEEEVFLMQQCFTTLLWETSAHIPSFRRWLKQADQCFAYEYMRKLLQLIAWHRGDDPGRRWLLKSPEHLHDLDALLHVFPDARIVWTHRDPVKTLASNCSMGWNSMVRDSDSVDPHAVGRVWRENNSFMVYKTQRVRDEFGHPEQFLDVQYAAVVADPIAVLRHIYGWLELDFSAEAERAMRAWRDANPQHKAGAHRYELSDFGLVREEEEERFAAYRKRFEIPLEGA